MELVFENKKDKKEIIKKAKEISSNNPIKSSKSLVIKGDNLIGLSMLLSKYKGKIDLVYIDPPFNTSQIFTIDGERANTISRSTNGDVAYSDKMSLDEYLEFLRERLIIINELLSKEGSIYLHIDYKVGHYVKLLMDEIFGEKNFKNDITRIKSNPKNFHRKAYGNEKDLILFYSKDNQKNIWNEITQPLTDEELNKSFPKTDSNGRRYTTIPLHAPGETKGGATGMPWRNIPVPKGRHWRTDPKEFDILDKNGDIEWSSKGNPRIKKYADEHKGKKIQDIWTFKDPQYPVYPTEKNLEMIDLIVKQSSNKGSIVLDCFAGSGSTLLSAHNNGRKFIGIDNSNSSIKVIKTRELGEYDFITIK